MPSATPSQSQNRVGHIEDIVAHQAFENEKINWYYISSMKEELLGVEE